MVIIDLKMVIIDLKMDWGEDPLHVLILNSRTSQGCDDETSWDFIQKGR